MVVLVCVVWLMTIQLVADLHTGTTRHTILLPIVVSTHVLVEFLAKLLTLTAIALASLRLLGRETTLEGACITIVVVVVPGGTPIVVRTLIGC